MSADCTTATATTCARAEDYDLSHSAGQSEQSTNDRNSIIGMASASGTWRSTGRMSADCSTTTTTTCARAEDYDLSHSAG
jgi:hypothetical protein